MTTGSVLGTVSLLAVATAPSLPVFFAGWALAGLGMASTFYQPAFAALTRWWAPDHVRALTVVTLAGGLASTVFAPLTAPVLGGTFEIGEWDTTPSPATAAAILRRCTDLLPELAGAPVLGHRVGLRPFRDSGVRLEADPRPPGRIRRLVHNYGHGGVGVTLAWGCADAATTLVRQPR